MSTIGVKITNEVSTNEGALSNIFGRIVQSNISTPVNAQQTGIFFLQWFESEAAFDAVVASGLPVLEVPLQTEAWKVPSKYILDITGTSGDLNNTLVYTGIKAVLDGLGNTAVLVSE